MKNSEDKPTRACENIGQYETCINPHEIYYRGCTKECKYFIEEPSKGAEETTQLSGLSDYELELDKLADKLLTTKTSLERIGILRQAMEQYRTEGLREELIKFMKWLEFTDTILNEDEPEEDIADEYLKQKGLPL
jgi:hypothetical protein